MSPTPYIFKNEQELINNLNSIQNKVDEFYNKIEEIDKIIINSVGSNTYRAFKISINGNKPSETFRNWTKKYLINNISRINQIQNQTEFDNFIISTTNELCKFWFIKMKYEIGFGRAAKLLNLVFKTLPKMDLINNGKRKEFLQYLHIPLDSFSIRGLINIIEYDIPKNASMGFIDNKEKYLYFQEEIRKLSKKAGVYPIYFDILCWDLAH